MRKKIQVALSALACCGILGACACMAGCAESANAQDAADSTAIESEYTPMQEWQENYPLQYNSFATLKTKYAWDDGIESLYESSPGKLDRSHGHYAISIFESAPVSYDEDGNWILNGDGTFAVDSLNWDAENCQWVVDDSNWVDAINSAGYTQGCYACRTSAFDEVYAQEGAEIYTLPLTEEFMDAIEGQVWDCGMCHEGDPAEGEADAQLTMWTELAGEYAEQFGAGNAVCMQCHNTFDHRRFIADQDVMDSFDPLRYGTDPDSMWQAAMEDGISWTDDQTGIEVTGSDEPELVMFWGSAMSDCGLTCIDCHMPTVVDETTGESYTDHNASGSPLERQESLELCLSCHASDTIKTTDDVVTWIRDLQSDARQSVYAAQNKLDEAAAAIAAAIEAGDYDQELMNQLSEDWSRCYTYMYILSSDSNGRVIHNAEYVKTYVNKTNTMCDNIIDSLS